MASPTLSLSYIRALNIGKQSRAGALGLLAYDHLITLDTEVAVVWKQGKRNAGTWLYIFNRFFPLLWLILDTIPLAPGGIVSSKMCIAYLSTDDIVTLLSTLSVQTILQMRVRGTTYLLSLTCLILAVVKVYGLYSPNKRLFFILIAGCALEIAAMVILIAITMSHISRLPVVSTPTGCHYSGLFSLSALLWLPALVFEPVLCLFVVWKAWGDDILRWFAPHASTRSKTILTSSKAPPIVKAMARDSVIYFIAIFLELLANTIIWSHFNQYINVIMPWTCALPSILGSRLFIHMRQLMLHANEGIDEDVSTIALDTGIPGATSWSTDAPTSNTREHDDTV